MDRNETDFDDVLIKNEEEIFGQISIRSKSLIEGALVFYEYVRELGGIIAAKGMLQPLFENFY